MNADAFVNMTVVLQWYLSSYRHEFRSFWKPWRLRAAVSVVTCWPRKFVGRHGIIHVVDLTDRRPLNAAASRAFASVCSFLMERWFDLITRCTRTALYAWHNYLCTVRKKLASRHMYLVVLTVLLYPFLNCYDANALNWVAACQKHYALHSWLNRCYMPIPYGKQWHEVGSEISLFSNGSNDECLYAKRLSYPRKA